MSRTKCRWLSKVSIWILRWLILRDRLLSATWALLVQTHTWLFEGRVLGLFVRALDAQVNWLISWWIHPWTDLSLVNWVNKSLSSSAPGWVESFLSRVKVSWARETWVREWLLNLRLTRLHRALNALIMPSVSLVLRVEVNVNFLYELLGVFVHVLQDHNSWVVDWISKLLLSAHFLATASLRLSLTNGGISWLPHLEHAIRLGVSCTCIRLHETLPSTCVTDNASL